MQNYRLIGKKAKVCKKKGQMVKCFHSITLNTLKIGGF